MSTQIKNQIEVLVTSKQLIEPFESKNLKGCSYDLRIGTIFKDGEVISESYKNLKNDIQVLPSEIVTMLTLEVVNMPLNYYGTVFPINKQSSQGLLILNTGHIDPGYKGPISVCAINLSKDPKILNLNEPIFTILFDELSSATIPFEKNRFDVNNRKEYEKDFRNNKAIKFSKNFFNLLTSDDNALKELITKTTNSNITTKLLAGVAVASLFIVGVRFLIEIPFYKTSSYDEELRNMKNILNHKQDSIEYFRNCIKELKENYNDSTKTK